MATYLRHVLLFYSYKKINFARIEKFPSLKRAGSRCFRQFCLVLFVMNSKRQIGENDFPAL